MIIFIYSKNNINKMDKELKFEIQRKIIHFLAIIFILIWWFIERLYNKQIALLTIVFILIFFLIIEFFRLNKKKKIPFFHIFWRREENNKLIAHIPFLIGFLIAFAVFDFIIALVVILMTIFGDLTAAIIGTAYGKHKILKNSNISYEGTIAEFVMNIIIAIFFLSNWILILAIAFTATFTEAIFTHMDDNLAIPIFAGFIGQILYLIL